MKDHIITYDCAIWLKRIAARGSIGQLISIQKIFLNLLSNARKCRFKNINIAQKIAFTLIIYMTL